MKIMNRKALYDYEVLEKFELGIVLDSWEVKALRKGNATIMNAHISYSNPHIVIHNMHITSDKQNLDSTRPRILLVHKKERNKIMGANKIAGQTAVPLELYWNKKGFAKLLCAIVAGKKQYDKRASIKEREWSRNKERILKHQKLER